MGQDTEGSCTWNKRNKRARSQITARKATNYFESTSPTQRLRGAVGVMNLGDHSGIGHRESGNVGDGVEICGTVAVADPKALLPGGFEAGVIPLTFRAQGVGSFELQALAVDGEAVVVRDGPVLGTAAVLLAVVPVFVVAGALAGLGIAERTTILLPSPSFASRLAVLVHGQTRVADGVARGKLGGIFGVALIQRDDGVTVVEVLYRVVDVLFIVSLVANEGAFVDGKYGCGSGHDILGDGSVMDTGGRCKLIKRQAGDTVDEDMVLVAPVVLEVLLVVLV